MLRRNIPRSYRNVTGVAHSRAGSRSTPFESPLERDFIELLRFDERKIAFYDSQTPVIFYVDETGAKRRYTPDVFVRYTDGREVMYEVKTREWLRRDWGELKIKFKQAIRYGKLKGHSFKIVTESEIRTPYLRNVKFLSSCKRSDHYDPRYRLLIEHLRQLGFSTPNELVAMVVRSKAEKAEVLHTLWRLVADHIVVANLQEPLSMTTRIWYGLDGDYDEHE